MSKTFREVKLPLKRKDLMPVKEDNLDDVKKIHPNPYTYQELKQVFEENGLSINHLYMAKEGLYPFWYIDGFVFAPVTSLNPSVFQLHLNGDNVEAQKKRLQRYWEKGNYSALFSEVDSQFGFDTFFEHIEEIPEEKQYEIFRKLYTRNEYGFQDIDQTLIRKLFSLNPDKSFLKHIPVEPDGYVTIYRGMQDHSASPEEAYSWTLDFEVAQRFALRFNSTESSIYQARVLVEDIVDYVGDGNIGDRGEEEILVIPETLRDVKNMGFYNLSDSLFEELNRAGIVEMYQEYAHQRLKGSWFHKPDGIHGKRHIKRVLFLSLIMSYLDDLSEEDRQILIYASLYHDIGREHDWEDEEHGLQSVYKMEELKLTTRGLNNEEVRILKFIMKYHCIRDEVGLRKIKTQKGIQDKERAIDLFKRFKDCDNLDRVRLGDLDLNYIRTETGKKMMMIAYQLLRNIE
ncbi:hypothetical protein CVD28_24550 [Bacillus sp. M6-12]|uniref:HD domain-containing protein n=1 Tax=Bacillus sp. M6-12 TaxID=2054166 RepID=UPI000C76C6C1|nr:HD domain-containing protein [Bacillus sp. M6-12]PLS15053.1 hypothetical protein CVD28_24550 [Bacillus sp. M6-12]